jgi:hypothetical protein
MGLHMHNGRQRARSPHSIAGTDRGASSCMICRSHPGALSRSNSHADKPSQLCSQRRLFRFNRHHCSPPACAAMLMNHIQPLQYHAPIICAVVLGHHNLNQSACSLMGLGQAGHNITQSTNLHRSTPRSRSQHSSCSCTRATIHTDQQRAGPGQSQDLHKAALLTMKALT